jgi:crotonobetainyl-CoA:carnitine CoA-transferase CaiB-like acyl-CoA transferase
MTAVAPSASAAGTGAPLGHLTVVDLTHYVAGPYCTKLFADFGATVLKVERPRTGDPLRREGPFAHGEAGPERSLPFLWLNTAKRGLTIDLKSPEGRALLHGLLDRADALVENFSPGVMERLGLADDALASRHPRLVRTSIRNFGETGPYREYRATEMTLYAMSGGMVATGDRDRAPLASGPAIMQYTAGMHAYLGTLMALYRREATGRGERVEVSIQESGLENVEVALTEHLHLGRTARRSGDQHTMVPWQCHPCADGQAAIMGGPVRRWLAGARMFDEPRLLEEPFRDMAGRMKHRAEFESLLRPWLARHSKVDIYHAGQRHGLAFGYLATLAEAFASPQHRARQFFTGTDPHPEVGSYTVSRPPFRMAETPPPRRAPLLGEHNDLVFGEEMGYAAADLDRLRGAGVI